MWILFAVIVPEFTYIRLDQQFVILDVFLVYVVNVCRSLQIGARGSLILSAISRKVNSTLYVFNMAAVSYAGLDFASNFVL